MHSTSRLGTSLVRVSRKPCLANSLARDFTSFQCTLRDPRSLRMRHSSTATATKEAAAPAPSPFVLSRSEDFDKINAARPQFDYKLPITTTSSPAPGWKYGESTTNHGYDQSTHEHVEIDPSARSFIHNYKLLVSAIPRPISFVSTVSKDGTQKNLAPFSYFQVVDHDPPIFVIGFSGRPSRLKDTRRNLLETGECVISVVSEHMIEGVNAASLDVPYGTSEWGMSGFKPVKSSTVRPERVADAVFSVEGKLLEMKELSYHGEAESGKATGALAIIEGTRLWVRKDAINEAGDDVDLSVMRPLVALGGISYGRVSETFELPRGYLPNELKKPENGLARILARDNEA